MLGYVMIDFMMNDDLVYSSWGSAYTVVDKPYFVCLILQPSNVLLDSECFVKVSHCCFSTLILFK